MDLSITIDEVIVSGMVQTVLSISLLSEVVLSNPVGYRVHVGIVRIHGKEVICAIFCNQEYWLQKIAQIFKFDRIKYGK